jgi:hypothetical protein
VTRVLMTDGYRDQPTTPRGQLEYEIARLKMLSWADPGDRELRQEIERLEAELRRMDGGAAHGN